MRQESTNAVAAETVAVVDIGASAVRLVVAELRPGGPPSSSKRRRGACSLGKDTFSTGRIGPGADGGRAAGARRVQAPDGRVPACSATGPWRPARCARRPTPTRSSTACPSGRACRSRSSTGPKRAASCYLAVRNQLRAHPRWRRRHALLVEVGGGSADITLLEGDRPKYSGVYALGSVRMRQSLGRWTGDARPPHPRCSTRHIGERRSATSGARCRCQSASYMIAFGNDVRFAAQELVEAPEAAVREVPRDAFIEFCAKVEKLDEEELVDRVRPLAGGRRDARARAARLPRAARGDLRRGDHRAAGVAAGRPARRPGRARARPIPTASPSSPSRCWPAPRRSARSTGTTPAHAQDRGATWRRACSTNCGTSTG